jgi:hypothetical protein
LLGWFIIGLPITKKVRVGSTITGLTVLVSIDDSSPEICQIRNDENTERDKDIYVSDGVVRLYLPCGQLLPWGARFKITDQRPLVSRLAQRLQRAADDHDNDLLWSLIREPCRLDIDGGDLVFSPTESEPTALLTVISFIGGTVEIDTSRALFADFRENGPIKALCTVTDREHPVTITVVECYVDRGRYYSNTRIILNNDRVDQNLNEP